MIGPSACPLNSAQANSATAEPRASGGTSGARVARGASMTNDSVLRGESISAWLDGELLPEQRQEVEDWLREHPEEAAHVRLLRADRDALRERLAAQLHEPLPEALRRRVLDEEPGAAPPTPSTLSHDTNGGGAPPGAAYPPKTMSAGGRPDASRNNANRVVLSSPAGFCPRFFHTTYAPTNSRMNKIATRTAAETDFTPVLSHEPRRDGTAPRPL